MNDQVSQGAGEDLVDMTPDELRAAIDAYLDKGPDFIKYGGTAHFARPAFIGFSPEAQRVMVEEAHKRGKKAETHATTPDGLRLSVEAGIDGIQHPEMLGPRELPDALVRTIVERRIVCNMLVNTITGDGVDETPEGPRRGAEEGRRGSRQGARASEDLRRAAEGRRGPAAGDGDAAEEREEADCRGRGGDRGHRQLLGRGRGAVAHAEARERRITASARSSASRGWSSWA